MSIANIICQGAAGHLITDSGYFHLDGRLAFLRPKTLELPSLRVAIATRGHTYAREDLGPLIEQAQPRNQGELFGLLPELLHTALVEGGAYASGAHDDDFTTSLHIIYFDAARRRAGGLILSSSAIGMPDDYAAYSYIPVTDALAPGVDEQAAIGRPASLTDSSAFDVERDGLKIAQAQRQSEWSFNGLPAGHHAAGAVRLTTVDANGVRSRVIHTWHDRLGEKVAA